MSLYNMLHGVNQVATFFALPMLGKHPDEYPRFRDCFLGDEDKPEYSNGDHILVYTRVGGGNRGQDYGEEELMNHPEFVATYDDEFDNTFGIYVFTVPKQWKDDMKNLRDGNFKELTPALWDKMREVYPKLKDKFDDFQKQAQEEQS